MESLKAGAISGIAAASAFGLLTPLNHALGGEPLFSGSSKLMSIVSADDLLSSAVVLVSGLLFGITYRYVVQAAPNPHLKSGAVLAFGLVRGLAQIDTGLQLQGDAIGLLVLAGESLGIFAIAALVLEWTMASGIVKAE